MSTTRHLVNRQRRLAATAAVRERETETVPPTRERGGERDSERTTVRAPERTRERPAVRPAKAARPRPAAGAVKERRDRRPLVLGALALLTVLLGSFAGWAAHHASVLRDDPATHNTALTDNARTSEVKGTVAQEINTLFSYNYADPSRTDDAAKTALTGSAVKQYADMLAGVREQAPALKLVLTTTVTDSGVELLDGDRARLLIFADQRNTSTGKTAESSDSAAMFAVDAVRQGGTWKISNLDTFSR